MNNLFTFGCSFTEDFRQFANINNIDKNTRTQYIHRFCDGIPPECWSDVLGGLLNFKVNNFGANNARTSTMIPEESGNSNDHIFNNFCHIVEHINEGDVVIIQWTFMERFLWVDTETNKTVSILPNQYTSIKNKNLMDEILVNKSHHLWFDQLFIKEKLINECAKFKKFNVFFWSMDDKLYKLKKEVTENNSNYLFIKNKVGFKGVVDLLNRYGRTSITNETNNQIQDSHFGKVAHKVLGELIYEDIKGKI